MENDDKPKLNSKIWYEVADVDNPFTAKSAYCQGYDVTKDILPNSTLVEYLFLLFVGQRPTKHQHTLLEKIAVYIANPGLRDLSIRAAANAGVGGTTAAGCLIAAIAVGAGQYTGAREIYTLVENWHKFGYDEQNWTDFLKKPNSARTHHTVWPEYQHPPGFDPNADQCATVVLDLLDFLAKLAPEGPLAWLQAHRLSFEHALSMPINITCVIAAGFFELGLNAKQSEMLYLLLRLPGAAVHALEQEEFGWRKFPFFGQNTTLTDDPGAKDLPQVEGYEP